MAIRRNELYSGVGAVGDGTSSELPRGLHALRFGYLNRVLAERWALPARTPEMLDLTRGRSPMAACFARLGFSVARINLSETSLESAQEKLSRQGRGFDVVCVCDVLDDVDDWKGLVGELARALRTGGVFFHGSHAWAAPRVPLLPRLLQGWRGQSSPAGRSARGSFIPPVELNATLRREGLLPQDVVGPKRGSSGPYMGYALKPRGRSRGSIDGQWRFLATAKGWAFVRAGGPTGGGESEETVMGAAQL